MNRENLRILADYLDALPIDTRQFDMTHFVSTRAGWYSSIKTAAVVQSYHECGSVACAMGHGPLAGLDAFCGESWVEYEARVFALTPNEFDWCFTGRWNAVDNTPKGAAARIRWLLDNGVPVDFDTQLQGLAPLCYAVSA